MCVYVRCYEQTEKHSQPRTFCVLREGPCRKHSSTIPVQCAVEARGGLSNGPLTCRITIQSNFTTVFIWLDRCAHVRISVLFVCTAPSRDVRRRYVGTFARTVTRIHDVIHMNAPLRPHVCPRACSGMGKGELVLRIRYTCPSSFAISTTFCL